MIGGFGKRKKLSSGHFNLILFRVGGDYNVEFQTFSVLEKRLSVCRKLLFVQL